MDSHLRVHAIDSHTGGEPTRVLPEGEMDLRGTTMAERRDDLIARFDGLRAGLVREPRGADVWVGAALTPPVMPDSACGVVFFTTVGALGMCGHGTIGVVETLRHLGRVSPGRIAIDTPIGTVATTLHEDGRVSVRNVRSYRYQKDVATSVLGLGEVVGDVAWGGNWFFLAKRPLFPISLTTVGMLRTQAAMISFGLRAQGITGEDGAEIDHIELFGDAPAGEGDSTNFVLCPGGDYDRSPCGTGTSAKLACLYEDGLLAPGEVYRQRSVTGSVFEGSVEPHPEGGVIPTVTGRAWVTAESTFLFRPDDPLREGIR